MTTPPTPTAPQLPAEVVRAIDEAITRQSIEIVNGRRLPVLDYIVAALAPLWPAAPADQGGDFEAKVEACAKEIDALTFVNDFGYTVSNADAEIIAAILKAHFKPTPDKGEDTALIECLDAHRAFVVFKLDNGFITIGLPNGVSGSGFTLREALNDASDNQHAYETELQTKKEL